MAVISRRLMVPCWKRSSSSVRILTRRLESSGSATVVACRSLLIFICSPTARMGASWGRHGAAALLLMLAAALAPVPAQAGSPDDPEVTDPAGDQTVQEGDVPVVPGVNDEAFDDVDVVAAYVTQFSGLTRITVATTAGWSNDGSMVLGFTIDAGATSLAGSTASGQAFTVFVNGTAVEGGSGTAATTAEGLRIDLETAALGAIGGDLLSNLTITTSRTEDGFLVDLDPDDQTGSDEAGPGRAYMF